MISDLMIKEEKSEEEVKFIELHNRISCYGMVASQSIYEVGKAIKEINDNKLYLVGGYDDLGSYTEECFNIKKSQAYNYIKLVENVSLDFFQSTGKIGITKMLLLSDLENEEMAKEVINAMPEDSTVKDLEEVVKNLKKELKESKNQNKELSNQVNDLKNSSSNYDEELKKKDALIDNQKIIIDDLENKVNENTNNEYIKFTILFTDLQKKFKDALMCLDSLEGDLKSNSKKSLFTLLKQMESKCN